MIEFNRKVKKQLSGSAIGTKFAPTYASIFMDKLENNFLKSQELTPLLWYRYIDDVFFIWTHGEEKLASFIDDLNNYRPNIKFTHKSNKEHIPFLDLNVSLSGNKLSTDLYIISTDRHQYLHYTFLHAEHTKKSVVYSQALRLSRICSEEKDFKKHIAEMKSWFSQRGYPQKLIETETSKVKFSSRKVFHRTKVEKGVPLVVTYHLLLKTIGKIINDNLYLLYVNEEFKHLFTSGPMVFFRSSRKISSYLVRAKLYPVERSVGSFNCKRPRCQICTYVNETDSFTSTVTGEIYKINHKFDCMEKCLIYLLTCNKCRKQYVGQTVDTFRYRWNNYRFNSRKHAHGISCMQEHLYEHFCDSEHSGFLNDVSITFIDKTDPTNPLQREDYWKHTLKTFAPYGLNIKENVFYCFFVFA